MKKIILILMILLVTFSNGCDKKPDEIESPYVGGVNGVSLSFEPTAPLAEFTQDSDVGVKVKLINKGESEIAENSAKVKLYGVSPNEFNTLSFDYFNVESGLFPVKKDIFEEGGQTIVDLGIMNYNGLISSGYIEKNLFAKVCYPYTTKASVDTCITSQEIEQTGSSEICSYEGEKIKSGFVSSGPIQVTTFTEEPRGIDQIIFRIGFQNKGYIGDNKGQVFSRDAECENMDNSMGKLQYNGRIFVTVLPGNVLCSFSNGQYNAGFVELTGGEEKILVCTMDVAGESKYTQTVEINVDYKYIDSTSTHVKILSNQ